MIPVADNSGSRINGLFRNNTGGLVVSEPDKLNKYLRDKAIIEQNNKLQCEVLELRQQLQEIIKAIHGNTNTL